MYKSIKKGKCYIQQDLLTIQKIQNQYESIPPQSKDASWDNIWSLDTKYRNRTVVWDFVRRSAI